MKILPGDFNAKVGREDIFKPTIGNERLHEISNDNGVRVVNFATSKNLIVKSTIFPQHVKSMIFLQHNIHKFTLTSPDGKTHNPIGHTLIDRRHHSSIYKTITLPVVMYGCKTWSLTLREEHRLRVFEKQGAEENI
jgi:hypothetical protein